MKNEPVRKSEAGDSMARVAAFIERLSKEGFYGKLTIAFKNGEVLDLRTEQVMKVDEI